MRSLTMAALLAALPMLSACETLNSPERVQRDTVTEAARAVTRSYARTWNARDMTAFGALYASDARHVNTSGSFLRGRAAIVAAHRDNRQRYPESARMSTSLRGARAITNDAIVAVMAVAIRDDPRPEPLSATRLTLTLVRRDGAWVIAQAQASLNATATTAAPAPTAARTK